MVQVNIPAESGDMGILSSHVPSIEALRPGVVEVIETSGSQKFFGEFCISWRQMQWFMASSVSSGFATIHPNNKLTINVVEAAPLGEFSIEVTITIA